MHSTIVKVTRHMYIQPNLTPEEFKQYFFIKCPIWKITESKDGKKLQLVYDHELTRLLSWTKSNCLQTVTDVDEWSHHSVLALGIEVQAKFKLGEQADGTKRNNLYAGLLVLQKKMKRYFHLKVKKVMCKPP